MRENAYGFLIPAIKDSLCISCAKCTAVCPTIQTQTKTVATPEPECYALWADDAIRANSSSGGAFTLLARATFEKGGVVFGASWTTNCNNVTHTAITKEEELYKLRHSKYVQSDTGETFKETEKFLKRGFAVLYSGTPCQIAGLNNYLSINAIDTSLLITVDLLCFGVPSRSMWTGYLNDNFGDRQISDVTFRDKISGWGHIGYKIQLQDGSFIFPDKNNDAYQKCYHGVLFRNDVCENCKFSGFPRQGDVTLGDAWGY
jgi:coenzyme F420-reducing hydrogenase beta subunit